MNSIETIKGNWFYSQIMKRFAHNQNWICSIVGPTGAGKSLAALRLAFDLDIDLKTGEHRFPLDASRVVFNPKDFLGLIQKKGMEKLPPGSFIVLDEASLTANSRNFWDINNRVLSYIGQSFRFRGLGFIMTFPVSLGFLDKQARQLCHHVLKMKGIDFKKKQSVGKFHFLQTEEVTGKLYRHNPTLETKTEVFQLSHFRFSLPPEKLVNSYEKKKEKFLAGFYTELGEMIERSKTSKTEKLDLQSSYKKVLNKPDLFLDEKGKFSSAQIRVRLNLGMNNTIALTNALNQDLLAKRITIKPK